MQLKKFLLLIFISISTLYSSAQQGDLDVNFAYPVKDHNHYQQEKPIYRLLIQPDQHILTISQNRVSRLYTDGSYDSLGFSDAWTSRFDITTPAAMALQPDGKILIAGEFIDSIGGIRYSIIRINADGTLDTTFHLGVTGNWSTVPAYAVALQQDGKILVGGEFPSFDSYSCKGLMRLNIDGTLDTTFHVGTGIDGSVRTICIDSINNRIFVGGNFNRYNLQYHYNMICLLTDATPDTSFHDGTQFGGGPVNKIIQDSPGSIIVGGHFNNYNGHVSPRLVKLMSNGDFDSTFSNGVQFNDYVADIAIDQNGKILTVGAFTSYRGIIQKMICRLNSDGSLDTTYWSNGDMQVSSTFFGSIGLEANGNIVCSGDINYYGRDCRTGLIRFNPDGYLHNSLQCTTNFIVNSTQIQRYVTDIVIQPDGKIICAGDFDGFTGTISPRIVRLDMTGNIDTSFFGNGSGIMRQIALDTINHKIYAAGTFTSYDGIAGNNLVRLNWNGTIDTTFDTSIGFDIGCNDVLVQPDGKIIVAGGFSTYNNTSSPTLVRILYSGLIDSTFSSGLGFHGGAVKKILLQPDGKIIAAGSFDTYNGHSSSKIARINSDGSYDNSFIVNSGFNTDVKAICIDPYGRILAGGIFQSYQSQQVEQLVRLMPNGDLDSNFNAGMGTSFGIDVIALQRDEKILVSGISNNLKRLFENGGVDPSFNTGSGFMGSNPISIAIQQDDNLIVGGLVAQPTIPMNYIQYYQDYEIHGIARIFCNSLPTGLNSNETNPNFNLFPNPTDGEINIVLNDKINNPSIVQIVDLDGRIIFAYSINFEGKNSVAFSTEKLENGIYFVKIIDENKTVVKKFIVSR